jgi:hypothetical protein
MPLIAEKKLDRKVTIDYSDSDVLGVVDLEVEILLHQHNADGSELIVMRTQPRKSVSDFIYGEHGS